MKISKWSLGFAALLSAAVATEAQTAQTSKRVAFIGEAQVKKVEGSAQKELSSGQWAPLQPGDTLPTGSLFRTQADSRLILKMVKSDSYVSVAPNTVVRLAELQKGLTIASLTGKEEGAEVVVRAVRGKARVLSAEGRWQLLRTGANLGRGAQIKTEDNTIVDLFIPSQGRLIRMTPKTEIALHKDYTVLKGKVLTNKPNPLPAPVIASKN